MDKFITNQGQVLDRPPWVARLFKWSWGRKVLNEETGELQPKVIIIGSILIRPDKRFERCNYSERVELELQRLKQVDPIIWGIVQKFGRERVPLSEESKFIQGMQESFRMSSFDFEKSINRRSGEDAVQAEEL